MLNNQNKFEFLIPGLYFLISYPIFLKVFETSTQVIDEEFHLRQAKQYCLGNYHVWDPKITTLPGLYVLTTILLPFKFCTTFYLRLIVLLFSVINVLLFRQILLLINGRNKKDIWNAINISILPPMYFFAHLYYTDIISITSVLSLYYFWLKKKHKLAAFCGFCGIMIRQTNVIWILMFLGISCLNILTQNFKIKVKSSKGSKDELLLRAIKWHIINIKELLLLILLIIKSFWQYIAVICGFLIFVILNGSIVVGDKTAHVATIHLTQIFYFSLFVFLFGFSIFLPKFKSSLQLIYKNKQIFMLIFCLCLIIVKYNTLEHPYLLADNRHYTFYIWNRFYLKYYLFRYIIIPIYIFSLVLIYKSIQQRSSNFVIMFSLSTIIVLCLQNLLEIRYFLFPYILIRLNLTLKQNFILLFETIYYVIINLLTFYIFFTKEIRWTDFEEIQRLIW